MKGRGATTNTPNRFEQNRLVPFDVDVSYDDDRPAVPTTFYDDSTRTILAKNDSPDLAFTYSINPYRGCEHGCIYCYARPSHEYLGFSAGLDFESRIMVKRSAPALLEKAFSSPRWTPQPVAFSGNTDCYQPVERTLRLTRACLEVFSRFRNPVLLITKNALVLRDVDVLQELARYHAVRVMISLITLDADLARRLEPRTSSPLLRLNALEGLRRAGIPAGVNVAPVIPGLTDSEIPEILRQAAEHGAQRAAFSTVRLPGPVEPLFIEWLHREYPARESKVLNRIREIHNGNLNDSRFGSRMIGSGEFARTLHDLFSLNAAKYGINLSADSEELSVAHFKRPSGIQPDLFDDSTGF